MEDLESFMLYVFFIYTENFDKLKTFYYNKKYGRFRKA